LLLVLTLLFVNGVYGQLTVDFDFAPDSACSGEIIQFDTVSISGGSNNPDKYLFQWNFGDGNTSVVAKPTHSFEAFEYGYKFLGERRIKTGQGYLQFDETPTRVLDKDVKRKCHQGYYRVYNSPIQNKHPPKLFMSYLVNGIH